MTDDEAGAEYEVEEPEDAAEVLLSVAADRAPSASMMHPCIHEPVWGLLVQALADACVRPCTLRREHSVACLAPYAWH